MTHAFSSNYRARNTVILVIPAIKRTIRNRVTKTEDIDDLVQETLVKLLARENLAHIHNLEAYACKVAQTVVIDFWKLQNRNLSLVSEQTIEEATTTLEQEYITNEQLRLALNQIEQMPTKRKQVLVKRRIEGMSRGRIAANLGMSDESVKKHMTRAIQDLTNK